MRCNMSKYINTLLVAAGVLVIAGPAVAAPKMLYEQKRSVGVYYDMHHGKVPTISYPFAGWNAGKGSNVYFEPPFVANTPDEIKKGYPFWTENYVQSGRPVENLDKYLAKLGGQTYNNYLSSRPNNGFTQFSTYYGDDAVPPRKLLWSGWVDDYHTDVDINISGSGPTTLNPAGIPNTINTDHGLTVAIRDFAWTNYDNTILPGSKAISNVCSGGNCGDLKCRFRVFIKNNTGDVLNDSYVAAWKYGTVGLPTVNTLRSYGNDVGNVTFFSTAAQPIKVTVNWPSINYQLTYTMGNQSIKPGEAIDAWFSETGSRCFAYDVENISGGKIDTNKAPQITLDLPPCTIVPLYLDEINSDGRVINSTAFQTTTDVSTAMIKSNHTGGGQNLVLPRRAAADVRLRHACIPSETFKANDPTCGIDRSGINTNGFMYSTEKCTQDTKAAYAAGYTNRIDLPMRAVATPAKYAGAGAPPGFMGLTKPCTSGSIQDCLNDCSSGYTGGLCKSEANLGHANFSTDWYNPYALIFRNNCGGHFGGVCLVVNLSPANGYNNTSYIMPPALYIALGIDKLQQQAEVVMMGNPKYSQAAVQAALTQGIWGGLPDLDENGRSTTCFRLYCGYGCHAHLANPDVGACLSFNDFAKEIDYLLCKDGGTVCLPVDRNSCTGTTTVTMPFKFDRYDASGNTTPDQANPADAYKLNSPPRCEYTLLSDFSALIPVGIYRGVVSEIGASYDVYFGMAKDSIGEAFNCTVGRSHLLPSNVAARDRGDDRCYPDFARWASIAGAHTPVNSRLIRMYTAKDMVDLFKLTW